MIQCITKSKFEIALLLCHLVDGIFAQQCSPTNSQIFVKRSDISIVQTDFDFLPEMDTNDLLSTCAFRLFGTISFGACQKQCSIESDCIALYLSTSLECYLCRQGNNLPGFEPTEPERVFVKLEEYQDLTDQGKITWS